jgi:radical SAM superfamily enzyme YgiQ (UPF0313 family)
MKLMRRAGCWMIEYGIESGVQRILDNMKKNITLEQIRLAIENTRKAGIMSKGNFILGNIGETESTLKKTVRFACSLPLDMVQHTFLAPLPGTECHKDARLHGEFNDDWEATNTFAINFVPIGLTKEDLKCASRTLLRKFYLDWRRITGLFKKLTLRQIWQGLKAFVETAR